MIEQLLQGQYEDAGRANRATFGSSDDTKGDRAVDAGGIGREMTRGDRLINPVFISPTGCRDSSWKVFWRWLNS